MAKESHATGRRSLPHDGRAGKANHASTTWRLFAALL